MSHAQLPLDFADDTGQPWQPVQRFMEKPVNYLSDSELLEVILSNHLPETQAMTVSRDLLTRYGSLYELGNKSANELMQETGLKCEASCAILSAVALGTRATKPRYSAKSRLLAPAAIVRHFSGAFTNVHREEFHVLLLDTKMRLIKDVLITVGLVDRTQIHPREVFRQAIRESSSKIILVHNHPSGDPTPSSPDVDATTTLVAAGKIIGIEVMDHVIIGEPSPGFPKGYVSFREEKLIK